MAPRLVDLPAGSCVVVRALPDSARATSADLAVDLDGALAGALRKASQRSSAVPAGAAP